VAIGGVKPRPIQTARQSPQISLSEIRRDCRIKKDYPMPEFLNAMLFQNHPALVFIAAGIAIIAYMPWARITAVLRKYPITAFFTLALAVTWLAFIPYYYSTDSIPWFTFGPMLAGITMAAVTGGFAHVKSLLAAAFRWKVKPIWYVAAIGLPFASQYLSVLLNPLFGSAAPVWGNIPPVMEIIPMVALLLVFSGPIGEEIGWRGFALPRLLEKYSALAASLILGSIWAIWHLPLILVNDFTAHGAFMPVIAAVMFTWVFQNSKGSVLLAILMHASYQNSVRYLGKVFTDGDHVQQQWLGNGIWIVMIAAILLVYGARSFVNRTPKRVELLAQM
jgi:membrane protease YdiL (CAAX protease family)